ncbi:uncharacterized protein LOC121426895 [Lytechinus variegatus]|uniref:uncharacterized protein LOC121426895 n=1 Tax=Lytechinus variegatus TaxID=7654 RepID=UPI001BB22816|nr:uncharacterized protein LOC121426895 [Lytechinus variegatus]
MERFTNLLTVTVIVFVLVPVQGHRSFQYCRPKCPECPQAGLIPLEDWQLIEIQNAQKRVAALKTNRSMTYSNTMPIVSGFTTSQKEQMREIFGQYFFGDQTSADEDIMLWDETNPSIRRRFKRGADHLTRVCPVIRTPNVLVTVYDANGYVIQVVQADGHTQRVFREICVNPLSTCSICSKIGASCTCMSTVRFAYIVGFHVDMDNQPTHIQAYRIQIESCTSVMSTDGPKAA